VINHNSKEAKMPPKRRQAEVSEDTSSAASERSSSTDEARPERRTLVALQGERVAGQRLAEVVKTYLGTVERPRPSKALREALQGSRLEVGSTIRDAVDAVTNTWSRSQRELVMAGLAEPSPKYTSKVEIAAAGVLFGLLVPVVAALFRAEGQKMGLVIDEAAVTKVSADPSKFAHLNEVATSARVISNVVAKTVVDPPPDGGRPGRHPPKAFLGKCRRCERTGHKEAFCKTPESELPPHKRARLENKKAGKGPGG